MNQTEEHFNQIIKSDGPWTAHNFIVKDDFYTIKKELINDEFKLTRVIQNISDLTQKSFSELRILDLACLEGMFGIECARQGAEVTFLDARDVNLTKVKFATKEAGLDNVNIVKDDVRAISSEKYGKFDVILCFGIFYHLDKNDLYNFVSRMFDMCTGIVFFDTHVTSKKKETFIKNNIVYYGESYQEHRSDASQEEKDIEIWKSLDNQLSFKMTRVSLVRMLHQIGFTSAFESYLPFDRTKNHSRISMIAVKGKQIKLQSTPLITPDNNYFSEEIYFSVIFSEKLRAMKNNIIYLLKLNAPRFIRTFYKKNIKRK